MMQGVRYRERGPMKSWRPETMAEAIWAVLQEGICFFNFLLGSIYIRYHLRIFWQLAPQTLA